MNLTQLIKDMKEKGLMSVSPIKLRGNAKPILEFIAIMNNTEVFTPSIDYCQIVGEYYTKSGGSLNLGTCHGQ